MTDDLFLAILSMDAYNRGYDAGIDGLGSAGSKVGLAEIIDADLPIGSVEAGFYASAYDLSGQTVISYRGTDVDSLSELANEALNGYITAVGGALSTQALMAAEFYQAVTGSDESNPINTQALLTGHSLGGGLAGYIASLYHQQGVLFDNMAFEEGAQDAYDKALAHGTIDAGAVGDLIWQDIYNGFDPAALKFRMQTLRRSPSQANFYR